jgi:hypothetical protein
MAELHPTEYHWRASMNPLNLIPPESRWILIGFGLVIGNILLSWLAAMVVGGFKFGSLERRVAHSIPREQYGAFLETLQQRLAELGFLAGAGEGIFVQGGAATGNLASFTHAKTRKELRVQGRDEGGAITMELSLRYLDPIAGDSGESAYRDAVLDYVSGRTDVMQVVPNRSYSAVSSFVGGVLACAAMLVLKFNGYRPVTPPILMFAITEVGMAVLALNSIRQKPRELTGRWMAVAGIGLSVLAVVGAMVL